MFLRALGIIIVHFGLCTAIENVGRDDRMSVLWDTGSIYLNYVLAQ